MPASSAERNPVEELAEEFAERYRRGERPPLTEYTDKYPQWAAEIRDLFPALVIMEQLKPKAGEATGDYAVAHSNRLPLRLGDYRILREVGRGGMGIVYEAEQESLGRHVALKVLPPHGLLNPTFLERFRREAKAAAKLHHTNIVPVYGVGECNGVHFYAMQFIRGEGLDKVLHDLRRLRLARDSAAEHATLARTRLEGSVAGSLMTGRFGSSPDLPASGSRSGSLERSVTATTAVGSMPSSGLSSGDSREGYYRSVARIGLQIADALTYAHRQGVLHRDVKPSNLLLDAQGIVWITDFGLAKEAGPGCQPGVEDLTHTGDIVGTVRFMAPERFDGQSLPQSDVYGLGVTLYELLTLRPAFDDANKARLVELVLHESPVWPRKIEPDVPRDLETIVLKCLAKEQGERYATAEALADDLRRFLADRPIRARRVSSAEKLWRWCRRNPSIAALAASVAFLLVVVSIGSVLSAAWLRTERNHAVTNLDRALRAEEELTDKLRLSYRDQARAGRWSGQVGRRFNSLDALAKAAAIRPDLELRNEAIACMALVDLRRVKPQPDCPPDSLERITFDARLERYAFSDSRGNIVIRSVTDDRELLRLPGPDGRAWVTVFSRDGRFLAAKYHRENQPPPHDLQVWDLLRREVVWRSQIPAVPFVFSPDSRKLAVGQLPGGVSIHDLTSPNSQGKVLSHGHPLRNLAFHPDGRRMAISLADSTLVQIYDLATSKVLTSREFPAPADLVAWHPGGKQLAVASPHPDNQVRVWDIQSNTERTLQGHQGDVRQLSYNQAGTLLASRGWDDTNRFWDGFSGRPLVTTSVSDFGGFSPDGSRVAVGGAIWEIADGSECRTLYGHVGPDKGPWSGDFSPDGLFASASGDGVRLWDPLTGKELAWLQVGYSFGVVFNPRDGSLITAGAAGLRRWPIWPKPGGQTGDLLIGPPESFTTVANGRQGWLSFSRDGRRLAVSDGTRSEVLVLEVETGKVLLRSHHGGVDRLALSPDGRWLACNTWGKVHGAVGVWDVDARQQVTQFEAPDKPLAFSPDGKFLVVGYGNEAQYRHVGSWESAGSLRLERQTAAMHCLAFSQEGSVLAVTPWRGEVRLLDWATGQELASLAASSTEMASHLAFSRDDRWLAVVCQTQVVQLWDLHRIRRQLSEIGLDWQLPGPPPTIQEEKLTSTPRIEIDYGELPKLGNTSKETPQEAIERWTQRLRSNAEDVEAYHHRAHAREKLGERRQAIADFTAAIQRQPDNFHFHECRGRNYLALKDHARAAADFEKALELKPEQADLSNNLAWLLVTGPEELRDGKKAVLYAEHAVKLAPTNWHYHNTLGVALYRAERYQDAIAPLEASLKGNSGRTDGFDLFFLAACHAKLGESEKAKDYFDRAVKWMDGQENLQPQWAEELKTFREEAEEVLGIK